MDEALATKLARNWQDGWNNVDLAMVTDKPQVMHTPQ